MVIAGFPCRIACLKIPLLNCIIGFVNPASDGVEKIFNFNFRNFKTFEVCSLKIQFSNILKVDRRGFEIFKLSSLKHLLLTSLGCSPIPQFQNQSSRLSGLWKPRSNLLPTLRVDLIEIDYSYLLELLEWSSWNGCVQPKSWGQKFQNQKRTYL